MSQADDDARQRAGKIDATLAGWNSSPAMTRAEAEAERARRYRLRIVLELRHGEQAAVLQGSTMSGDGERHGPLEDLNAAAVMLLEAMLPRLVQLTLPRECKNCGSVQPPDRPRCADCDWPVGRPVPDAAFCAVCRRRHGPEVTHACE
jgi:hypothetical protein